MTRDSDFKNIVRARMAETGQTYTAARADLMGEGTSPVPHDTDQARPAHRDHASGAETTAFVRASAEQAKIIGRFFHDGRLTQVPMKRKVRAAFAEDEEEEKPQRKLIPIRRVGACAGDWACVCWLEGAVRA